MLKKTFIICAILSINSCTIIAEPMPKSWNWGLKPRPLTGVRGFPETDTDYGKGFKNGCTGAWQVTAKGLVDALPSTINPTMISKNPNYAAGWWDGFEQCVYIIDWEVL